jgi:hypothetical protein
VTVGDDLDALCQPDEGSHVAGASAFEQAIEWKIHRTGDMTLPRVAVSACFAVELRSCPNVEEREVIVAEASTKFVQHHVFH